jgi:serine/threonine-protein kinase
MTLAAGTQLEHYRILAPLGQGGMGEVYLAEDTTLRRRVALKILPHEFTRDDERLRRFQQEAFTASALNHPNIITIHEVGEAEGVHFIATEFIEGESLRRHISGRRLDAAEALEISTQVAAALAEAHGAGVAHRDIKPENVMLRRDHIVKVLDFGLAKLTEAADAVDAEAPTRALVNTERGVVMGTATYMSPEQARGLETDERTDIWSLGVVLYEMLAGSPPFTGETATDIIAAIVKSQPAPLARLAPDVPPKLEEIVSKALEKDREERYQTAKDFLVDLRRLKRRLDFEAEAERSVSPDPVHSSAASADGGQTTSAGTNTQPAAPTDAGPQARTTSSAEYIVSGIRRHKSAALAALLVSLLALGALGYWYSGRRTPGGGQVESIAVLPFENVGGSADTEYLSDGVTESLINDLSRLSNLRVIARSTVFSLKGRGLTPQQVGKQLNVRAVLTGKVLQRGDLLDVQVDLIDADNDAEMWGARYQRKQADILSVQDEIARDVTDRLRLKLTGEDRKLLAKRYTDNSEAYELYLKGRYHYYTGTEDEWRKSLDYFNAAVAKDPNFALAYVGIADCYGLSSGWLMPPTEAYPKIEKAARKALQIDDTLADAWAELGAVKLFYDHDWAGAERDFKHALELNPDSYIAHEYYSFYLYALGRTDESVATLKQGLQSDPLSLPFNTNLGYAYYYAHRYDDAIESARNTLEIDPNSFYARLLLGNAYQLKGQYDAAIAEYRKLRDQDEGPWAIAYLGNVYAVSGRKDEAQKALAQLQDLAKRRYVSPFFFALVYTGLGDQNQALAYLDKAYEEHNDYLAYLKVEPLFDPLRSDPRFQELIRKIGFPQ